MIVETNERKERVCTAVKWWRTCMLRNGVSVRCCSFVRFGGFGGGRSVRWPFGLVSVDGKKEPEPHPWRNRVSSFCMINYSFCVYSLTVASFVDFFFQGPFPSITLPTLWNNNQEPLQGFCPAWSLHLVDNLPVLVWYLTLAQITTFPFLRQRHVHAHITCLYSTTAILWFRFPDSTVRVASVDVPLLWCSKRKKENESHID